MGDNYYTEVSDVLTDAFDVLKRKLQEKHPLYHALIADYVDRCRKSADKVFREQYSEATGITNIINTLEEKCTKK